MEMKLTDQDPFTLSGIYNYIVLIFNNINFAKCHNSVKYYYEQQLSDNSIKNIEDVIIPQKKLLFIKAFRMLVSVSRYFKTIGYFQGFHYMAIFLAELGYSERVLI